MYRYCNSGHHPVLGETHDCRNYNLLGSGTNTSPPKNPKKPCRLPDNVGDGEFVPSKLPKPLPSKATAAALNDMCYTL